MMREEQGKFYVFDGREGVEELERLKNEADLFATDLVRAASLRLVVDWPSMRISPEVGKSIAPQRFKRVDLPQPLRPTRAMNWPGSTVREMLLRAETVEPSVR